MLAKNFLTTIFLLCCSTVALWWGCRFANAAGDWVKIAVGDDAWTRMNALERVTRDEMLSDDRQREEIKGMLNEWLKEAEEKKDTNAVAEAIRRMVQRHDAEHSKGEWRCPLLKVEIFVEKVSLREEHVMTTMTKEEPTKKQTLWPNAKVTNIKLRLYRAEGIEEQVQTAYGLPKGNLLSFILGHSPKRTFEERLSEVFVVADMDSKGSYDLPPDSIKTAEILQYQWAAASLNKLDTAELYMATSKFYLKATVTKEIELIKLVFPWHELRERLQNSQCHSQLVSGACVGSNSNKPSAGNTPQASTP